VTAVAVVVLATTLLSAVGVIAWLAFRVVKAAEQEADARVGQVATEAESERTAYELDVTQKALTAANKRADALEEIIADEINDENPNPDLARTDVRTRLLRIAGKWREAAATRSPLPAESEPAVPAPAAPVGPKSASVPDDNTIDVQF
jgi:hypothetical protein